MLSRSVSVHLDMFDYSDHFMSHFVRQPLPYFPSNTLAHNFRVEDNGLVQLYKEDLIDSS